MNNAYNTNDPEILLRLKRQEAEALLDVIRSFNDPRIKTEQIFMVAKNTLLGQLGVKRMKFIYKIENEIRTGLNQGFGQVSESALKELPRRIGVVQVNGEKMPELSQMGIQFIIPIPFKNQINAWFFVADFADSPTEMENDLIFIETLGNILSASIENRELVKEFVAQTSLERELEVAERIQKQLLTHDFSAIRHATIDAKNIAHHRIGGDFFDVIPRGEKGFFVCIADVAGKGIGAALLMANLQANLRAQLLSNDSLEEVVIKLHHILLKITQGDQFVTLFLAYINTDYRFIEYINSGHNPPVLFTEGRIEKLTKGTVPLGIVDLPGVELGEVSFNPGDTLILYTDGLIDQNDKQGNLLGEDFLLTHIESIVDKGATEIVDGLVEMHSKHADGVRFDDDVTLLVVKFDK